MASRISAVFDYAQDTGLIEQHGAAGFTRMLVARKTKKPMVSIPPEEAGALMRAIDGYDDSVTRLGLLLLAHTFVRVGELRGLLWEELKEGGAVWVVSDTRVKMRMPHVVPLSRGAVDPCKASRDERRWCARARFAHPPGASAFREHLSLCAVSTWLPWANDRPRVRRIGFDGAQ